MLHQQLLTWSFKEVDLHAAERYSRFEVVSDSRFLLAEDLGHLRTQAKFHLHHQAFGFTYTWVSVLAVATKLYNNTKMKHQWFGQADYNTSSCLVQFMPLSIHFHPATADPTQDIIPLSRALFVFNPFFAAFLTSAFSVHSTPIPSVLHHHIMICNANRKSDY